MMSAVGMTKPHLSADICLVPTCSKGFCLNTDSRIQVFGNTTLGDCFLAESAAPALSAFSLSLSLSNFISHYPRLCNELKTLRDV